MFFGRELLSKSCLSYTCSLVYVVRYGWAGGLLDKMDAVSPSSFFLSRN